MDKSKYDFGGWATKNDIVCSDERVIKQDAFKHQDGHTVPLVWNHNHTDIETVLGHALLENRKEGVYAYCSFNETERGKMAKEHVRHGDICALSIYANKLKQNGKEVIHGDIREVSLVLAGANPGAFIDTIIAHSDDADEEAIIYNPNEELTLYHSETEKETNTMENETNTTQTQDDVIAMADGNNKEETIQDVFDTMNEKQKAVCYALVAQALEEAENKNSEEGKKMSHNAFEDNNNQTTNQDTELLHAEILDAIKDGKRMGSMREAFLEHGITDVGNLFPEVKPVSNQPETIKRRDDWVAKVMGAVKHTPFSRVKSTAINITADEARAKGYVKGEQKVSEVVTALKRSTTPTTVYKLQKMDRDDVLDITDFDVIMWLKNEMRDMLNEELARAFLIGDGRSSDSNDKINEQNIRPILGDNEVYTIAKTLEKESGDDEYVFAKKFIRNVIKSRKEYKGSGNPTMYCTEDLLTDMLLIEDTNGRVIYDSVDKLATALRVKEIVSVPVFENHVRTSGGYDYTLMAIVVNLADYNVGTDRKGEITMFDDFDINYNKYEYLIETRCSGALVKPYSAITFEEKSVSEVVAG